MTNCPEYREPISSCRASGVERKLPAPIKEERDFGGVIPGRKPNGVINNEQLRLGFGRKCRELFRGCMVLRYKRVEAFGHLGVQLKHLRLVDQNITPITGFDCFLRRTCIT